MDIFLETSGFSYDIPGTDDFKAMIEHVGYIQKLHYVYSNCFYDVEFCPYTNARFHHMDVRDIGYYADSFFMINLTGDFIKIKMRLDHYFVEEQGVEKMRINPWFDFFVEMTNLSVLHIFSTLTKSGEYVNYEVFKTLLTSEDPRKDISIILKPLKLDIDNLFLEVMSRTTNEWDKKSINDAYHKYMKYLNNFSLVLTKHGAPIHKIKRQLNAVILDGNEILANHIVNFTLNQFKNYQMEPQIITEWQTFYIQYVQFLNKVDYNYFSLEIRQ